jgi:hypothetical protein
MAEGAAKMDSIRLGLIQVGPDSAGAGELSAALAEAAARFSMVRARTTWRRRIQ